MMHALWRAFFWFQTLSDTLLAVWGDGLGYYCRFAGNFVNLQLIYSLPQLAERPYF